MDPIELHSGIQRIRLVDDAGGAGLSLFLDGALQFSEREEYRYHESLGVVPMLFCEPRRVFIGGGGDGLLAARLLRFDGISEIVLCDYDRAVTDLARDHAELRRLNEGSLSDPRLRVVNADAFAFLEQCTDTFDLIVCDFPDPWYRPCDRLYSREFYEVTRGRLSAGGVLSVQTTMESGIAPVIKNTVGSVYPHVLFFWTFSRDFIQSGFTLASAEQFRRVRPVPEWSRYLDEQLVERLFVLSKDERQRFDVATGINTLENSAIARLAAVHWLRVRYRAVRPHPSYAGCAVLILDQRVRDVAPADIELALAELSERAQLAVCVDGLRRQKFGTELEALGFRVSRSWSKLRYVFDAATDERRARFWFRLDDGSVRDVDERRVAPGDDPEVDELVKAYATSHGVIGLDSWAGPRLQDGKETYLLCRDATRRVVLLLRAGDAPRQGAGVVANLLYAADAGRRTALGILCALKHLRARGMEEIVLRPPTPRLATLLLRLGAEEVNSYTLYERLRS